MAETNIDDGGYPASTYDVDTPIEPETLEAPVEKKIYVKVKKGQKIPLMAGWQENPIGKEEIDEWVKKGGNKGILYSKLTKLCCIDVDYPDKFPVPSIITNPITTTIKTNKGYHLIFNRPDGLQNAKYIWGDFLYEKRQGVAPPSIVNGIKREYIKKIKPIDIPEEIMQLLKEGQMPVDAAETPVAKQGQVTELNIPRGARNDTLTHIMGIVRNKVQDKYLTDIMQLFNSYLSEPLPAKDIYAMCHQANKYNIQDNSKLTDIVCNILTDPMKLQDLQRIIKSEGIDTTYDYLKNMVTKLTKTHRIFRISRGVYKAVEETNVAPVSEFKDLGNTISYNIPINITNIADIYPNSVLVIASRAGTGKTHIFAHIIKGLLEQDVPCTYWDMENDVNNVVHIFKKYIPERLLNKKDMLWINKEDVSIDIVKLHPDRVNFIDPIYVEDGWGEVDNIMRNLKKQLNGGLCFIATHLKDVDGKIFGGQTAMKVPALVMEIKHPDNNRFNIEFKMLKIRNYKMGVRIKKFNGKWQDDSGLEVEDIMQDGIYF